MLVESHIRLVNTLHHFTWSPAAIRRPFMEHFVQQNTQGPDVHIKVLRLASKDFWRHVFKRAAESDSVLVRKVLGTPAEVAEFHVDLIVE